MMVLNFLGRFADTPRQWPSCGVRLVFRQFTGVNERAGFGADLEPQTVRLVLRVPVNEYCQ
eukprot:1208858-Rhodomonas_salina.1